MVGNRLSIRDSRKYKFQAVDITGAPDTRIIYYKGVTNHILSDPREPTSISLQGDEHEGGARNTVAFAKIEFIRSRVDNSGILPRPELEHFHQTH